MGGTSDQLAATRTRVRAALVLLISLAVLIVTSFTPALATGDGEGDLESVRATVTAKYNGKIEALQGLKNQTENAARQEIYQGGINQLVEVRDTQVATATDVDTLWSLKELAHSIYNQTVAAAENVPLTPAEALAKAKRAAHETVEYKIHLLEKWIEGCDDEAVRKIVADGVAKLRALFGQLEGVTTADQAWAIKDRAHAIYHETMDRAEKAKDEGEQPPPEKSEEEKRAEALEAARKGTLSVIEHKAAILRSAAAAAKIPAVVEVYVDGAEAIEALKDDAKAATSIQQLNDIKQQVQDLFERTKEAAAAIRDDSDGDPVSTLDEYLDEIVDYVEYTTTALEPTSDESPETYAALVDAKGTVLVKVEAVREVADSGVRLGDRWDDLDEALSAFRKALVRHYIALGEPYTIHGMHIPG